MEYKFEGMTISSEKDIRKLVKRIHSDPDFAKRLEKYGIGEEYIDERTMVSGYRGKIKERSKREFRKEHECRDCADYFTKSCKGLPPCKYEDDFQREKKVRHEKPICPMDKTGDCPYGRPEGICIGIPSCYRDVIKGIRGGNGRNEPSKEDSGNG